MPDAGIQRLLDVMARLRNPDTGCPWDVEQTFATIAPYTIEEAYEVVDAIERENLVDLREELGDLLLQVVFHARMAEETQAFNFNDVASDISEKMIRRHPHVFADVNVESTEELNSLWENQKAIERQAKSASPSKASALDGVALNLPALTRAEKVQKRARRAGFDWYEFPPVADKVREELAEVIDAQTSADQDKINEEVGDLLFAAVNLARHLKVDPEAALRKATTKFSNRFKGVEDLAAESGIALEASTLAELDSLWNQVKARET